MRSLRTPIGLLAAFVIVMSLATVVAFVFVFGRLSMQAGAGQAAHARQCVNFPGSRKNEFDEYRRGVITKHDMNVFFKTKPDC